jgi:hypothetical protein
VDGLVSVAFIGATPEFRGPLPPQATVIVIAAGETVLFTVLLLATVVMAAMATRSWHRLPLAGIVEPRTRSSQRWLHRSACN